MSEWNPNKTGVLGLEYMPIFGGLVNLDAPNKAIGTSWDQTASQVVGTVQVPNTAISVRGGIYVVEAYDNETAVGDLAAVSVDAVPNEDVTDGTWLNEASSNVNLFASIDEGAPGSTTDYIAMHGTSSQLVQRFNTGSLSLTGKRILAVRLGIRCALGSTAVLVGGLNISSTDYPAAGVYAVGPKADGWIYGTFTYNPATKKPWTIADVQAFDTTDEFYITAQSKAGTWSSNIVYAVTLTIYTVTETRLAFAILDDTTSALAVGNNTTVAWNATTGNMTTPTGGAWTKDGTGRHLFTVRRLSSVGSMGIPFVDTASPVAGVGTPFGLFHGWYPVLDTTYSFPTSMGATLTRLHAFILRTTAPADSVDSIPYAKLFSQAVYTGHTVEQELSNAAAADYGILKFWAYKRAGQTVNLDVKVKRRSDNVQFGTTYSLTPAVWDTGLKVPGTDPSFGWALVQVQLGTAATLATATQYYVEFSSTAASAMSWQVLTLDTVNAQGAVANFAGTTDNATVAGVEATNTDVLVTLSTIPVAPASLTCALGSQTVGETVGCVTAVPRADLSWAVTSLGAAFTRYEIQRSEDGGTTWADIAWVTVEAVAAWKDYEAKRGVAATYRIRVVRGDGAISPYRNGNASVTKPLLAGSGAYGGTMYLVSNYNPTQNLAYEYRPARTFDFNEASEQQRQGAYGRDYQLAANPLENRGVSPHWTFIVGVDDKLPSGGGLGWNAFTPLRNLARAVIPYICVLDHQGNRLLAALRVPNGDHDASGGADVYMAGVIGDEVASVPFVVTVTA